MFTIIGVLAGTFTLVKTLEAISDYYITKSSNKKWAEFMVLYNRLKAEHIARLNEERRK